MSKPKTQDEQRFGAAWLAILRLKPVCAQSIGASASHRVFYSLITL
jgi:hypothetical protein